MTSCVTPLGSTWFGASLLGLAFALAAPAHAQASGEDQSLDEGGAGQSEIVVTGTRLAGFSAPTPVTSLTAQDLETKAIRSVTDLMADIPALRFNQNNSQASAPIGASNLDLRGLGSSRTLLLLDGRRFAATDPSGGVDVSVIPAVLISKIEIVTGGASAAYGSDAVSGVVNTTLDSKLEGIKGSLQYGQTTHDDHHQPSATLAVGKALAGGRLHLVAAGDFYRNTGQLDQSTRDWGRNNYALLTNPAYTPTNGQPQRLILPGSTVSQMTTGGVTAINSIPALRGIQFGPNGTVLPFNYGTNVGTTFMTGGDGATPMATANISPRYTRYSGFGKATFDVDGNTSIYADVLWARSEAYADQLENPDPGNLVIRRDNAFLPASIRNLIPVGSNLTIGRLNSEDGVFATATTTTVRRYGFGAEGRFGGDWHWNAYAQLTRNSYERDDLNNRITANWLKAVDSIISPTTGQPVCRVNADASATNDDAACVPANVFGAGSISAAAVNYYTGTSMLRGRQRQNVFAASLNGSPFSLPAGEVRIAVGAEYRTEEVRQSSDPISQANGWRQINAQTLTGKYKVKEAFAEVGVPLLRGVPMASNLDLNGALRVTDYSTSGTVTTWKVGANYTPVDGLRFRGTISRDIRAPNVNELFSGQAQGIPVIIDPFFTPSRSGTPPVLTGGNPNLQPEKAKTYTAGIIVEPTALRGFHVSVDYYSISIDDAILALAGQQVVDGCFGGQDSLCGAITRDPTTNVITRVQATLLNAAKFETNGLDIEAAYSTSLGGGRLTARALANYVGKLYSSNSGELAGTTGQSNGIPHWRGNVSLEYRTDRFNVGTLVRYVQGGLYNNLYHEGGGNNSINNNRVGARTYVDLSAGYKIVDQVELFAKVNNLFDRDPPITPQVVTAASAAGSPFYDRVGRLIIGGVRFRF
jgi:outer membrane receptor protein involved in Fe transport